MDSRELFTEAALAAAARAGGYDLYPPADHAIAAGVRVWWNEATQAADFGPAEALVLVEVLAELLEAHRPVQDRDERITREVRRRVRELIAGLDAICWPEGSETPMPPNKYIVTRYHDSISIPQFKVSQLDPTDARNLGVWLIALADPTLKDAARELLSVMTR